MMLSAMMEEMARHMIEAEKKKTLRAIHQRVA